MSELQKFLFEGLPVRGMIVRLTDGWREVLQRREAVGGYPREVRELLGEMAAAGVLMQANIKFNGSLVLQVFGDGPVKLAVTEVRPDLTFRATAKVTGEVPVGARLEAMRPKFEMYRRATSFNRWPGLLNLVVWRAGHSPRIQRGLAEILAERKLAGSLLSWRGMRRLVMG